MTHKNHKKVREKMWASNKVKHFFIQESRFLMDIYMSRTYFNFFSHFILILVWNYILVHAEDIKSFQTIY